MCVSCLFLPYRMLKCLLCISSALIVCFTSMDIPINHPNTWNQKYETGCEIYYGSGGSNLFISCHDDIFSYVLICSASLHVFNQKHEVNATTVLIGFYFMLMADRKPGLYLLSTALDFSQLEFPLWALSFWSLSHASLEMCFFERV